MNINFRQILRYTIPSVLSMLVVALYVVVDGIFIGNRLGPQGLAAVNIALPFTMISAAVSSMVTIGGATICSIRLGRGDKRGAQDAFLVSALLAVLFGAVFTVAGAGFPGVIARLSGATDAILAMTIDYLRYFSLFQVFSILATLASCFVRIDGKPTLGFAGMIVGAITNIVLDWVFIYPLGMGVRGAAIASGLGQLVSLLLMAGHFLRKKGDLYLRRFKPDLALAGKVLRRGIPELATGMGLPVTTLCYNYVIIAHLGETGLAAYSVLSYIFSLVAAVFTGVSQGVQPLIGKAFGMQDKRQERYIFRTASLLNVGFSGLVYAALVLFGRVIISLFTSDPALIAIAADAVVVYGLSFVLAAINVMYTMLFQSTKQTFRASLISIMRGIVLSAACVFLVPRLFGAQAIWWAVVVTEALTLGIVIWCRLGVEQAPGTQRVATRA